MRCSRLVISIPNGFSCIKLFYRIIQFVVLALITTTIDIEES